MISLKDQKVIGRCLHLAISGKCFPDWEFDTLFGVTISEMKAIAESWPESDLSIEKNRRALNNVLNNLIGYPHNFASNLESKIGISRNELREVYNRTKEFFR